MYLHRWVKTSKNKEEVKTFQRRKRRSGQGSDLEENESNQIGRIPVIVPGRPDRDELFYLRLLLYHVPGPTGFDFLKRVEVQERAPDGSVKTTTKTVLFCAFRALLSLHSQKLRH